MCKYCDKDLEYRLCSLCGDIFPKELFYVTGKKEHTCDDGLKKIIEYRRTQCSECYLADQKRIYLSYAVTIKNNALDDDQQSSFCIDADSELESFW